MRPSESLVNILVRAVTIVAAGGTIGLVDSSIRGPVKTKLDAPPPLETPSGGGVSSPGKPPDPKGAPAGVVPVAPAVTPATQGGTPAPTPAPTPASAMPEGHITVAQARSLFDKQAAFVDARKQEDYEAGHVQGATKMELSDFKEGIPPAIEFMVKDAPVVVYCVGGHCDESEAVGKQLNLLGFTKVYIMHDGFPGWKEAGHPVETGPGQGL
jgi:rhodanese-related sulfurtransferase